MLARYTVARGALGGVLLGLDAVRLDGRPTRSRMIEIAHVVDGLPCASAAHVQALESALRAGLTTLDELTSWLPDLAAQRMPGIARIRRVLARRPTGAPPTESLLETLALQLARATPLGEMDRQHEVTGVDGVFVARVDLCRPDLGAFLELDGQHHPGQPVHDAARQTAIVAVTGWLPGRFTWHEITRTPRTSQRRMAQIAEQAAARRRVRS